MIFMIISPLIFLLFQETQNMPSVGWFDIFWMLIKTTFALVIVCGLAVLIFRYILPRLNVVSFDKSIVRVVDGTSLDARKRLIIVETAGKYMLLAVSESGVQLVSELESSAVEQAVADLEKTQNQNKKDTFSDTLGRFWKK